MFSELKQDSNLTREPSRLELPLSSRLEVTRLEQVNLTYCGSARECKGVGGYDLDRTNGVEVRDCGSTFDPLFIGYMFPRQIRWKLLCNSAH